MTVQGGAAVINADGSYEYTPPVGYIGDDSFEYRLQMMDPLFVVRQLIRLRYLL